MDFTVLFSPKKGFWSGEQGWTKQLTNASFIDPDTSLQIGFKSTPDIKRVKTDDCVWLFADAAIKWCFGILEKNTRQRAFEQELLGMLGLSSLPSEDELKKDLKRIFSIWDELTIAELITKHTTYDAISLDNPKGLYLVLKEKSETVEKAPYVPPYVPDYLKRQELAKSRRKKARHQKTSPLR